MGNRLLLKGSQQRAGMRFNATPVAEVAVKEQGGNPRTLTRCHEHSELCSNPAECIYLIGQRKSAGFIHSLVL